MRRAALTDEERDAICAAAISLRVIAKIAAREGRSVTARTYARQCRDLTRLFRAPEAQAFSRASGRGYVAALHAERRRIA